MSTRYYCDACGKEVSDENLNAPRGRNMTAPTDSLAAQVRSAREACQMRVEQEFGPTYYTFDAGEWDRRVAAAMRVTGEHPTIDGQPVCHADNCYAMERAVRALRGEAP